MKSRSLATRGKRHLVVSRAEFQNQGVLGGVSYRIQTASSMFTSRGSGQLGVRILIIPVRSIIECVLNIVHKLQHI
jgi:hypothetical protein